MPHLNHPLTLASPDRTPQKLSAIDGRAVLSKSTAFWKSLLAITITAATIVMLPVASIAETNQLPAIAWPSGTVDTWHGYKRYNFTVNGCPAWMVEPEKPMPGKPWSWCMEFPDAFTERCAAPALLAKGFHHVHIVVGNTFGSTGALRHFDAFYRSLQDRGLASKAVLIGLSRGGLYAYRWAGVNPEKVSVIYADAPVCDFKSWPGGKGKGKGSPADWQALINCYGFENESAALAFQGNPVDTLAPLAQARIALIHVVGDTDDVVPVEENTAVVETRYRKLGGNIQVIHKPATGHHPHGLEDPTPIVEFILKHTGNQGGGELQSTEKNGGR